MNFFYLLLMAKRQIYYPCILLFSFLAFHSSTFASHIMGTDLTYQWISGNTFRIKMTEYRDCSGATMGSSLSVAVNSASLSYAGTLTLNLETGYPIEVSSICAADIANTTCNGGTLQGVQEYVYSNTITLTGAATDWVFSYSDCCRNYSITTGPSGQSFYVEARLNNLAAPNNTSPDFSTRPVPYFGINQAQTYSHATTEPDGDILVYSLVDPLVSAGTPVTFLAPYTATYPIATTTGTFPINSTTGQINFTPNTVQNGVLCVLVQEFRSGVLIGSVRRDMQMIIINAVNGASSLGPVNNLTGASMNAGQTHVMTACAGVPVSFNILASDPNPATVITATSNATTVLTGSSFSTVGTNPKTINFSWTPTGNFVGYNSFYINITDNNCPIPSYQTVNIVLYVTGIDAYAADPTICQGETAQLNSFIFGTTGGTYAWSGPSLSATNIANPTATPATLPATYSVTYTVAGCTSTDNVVVSPDGSIVTTPALKNTCPGQAIPLTSVATLPVPAGSATPCGLGNPACVGASGLYTLGTGTTQQTYPFTGYWHDGRTQMLYTAAELTAAGLSGGKISSIALDVAAVNSTQAYAGFSVKIGCTSTGALSSYITGLSTAYSSAGYSPALGWNTFTFSTPYVWDGISNLVVEICYDNTSYTNYDYVNSSTTSFNSVYYYYTDGSTGCSMVGFPTAGTFRPNMRFDFCSTAAAAPTTYAWTPSTGLSSASISNPIATPLVSTTYIVTATRGACVVKDTVVINMDNLVNATPPTATFCAGSAALPLNATTLLTPDIIIPPCGTIATACLAAPVDYPVGVASTTTPFPFSGYWHDGRSQILFTASELTAAGVKPGRINSISLNVSTKGSTAPYNGFNLSIGCTSATTLSTFLTGLTNVYSGVVTTVPGNMTFTFSSPYGWDGVSNIVLEFCFDNTAYTSYDYVSASNTSFTSSIYNYVDGSVGCTLASSYTSTSRPVVSFNNCELGTPLTYAWSPANDLSASNIANPTSTPTANRNYTVTVSNGVCTATDNVDITFSTCVLPSESLNLRGTLLKEQDYFVGLDWETTNEVGVKSFTVQRRYADEQQFSDLTEVNANGAQRANYQYYDRSLRPIHENEVVFYRILETDIDAREYVSEQIEIKISTVLPQLSFSLYPNPANEILNLVLNQNNVDITQCKVQLLDNSGKVIQTTVNGIFHKRISVDIKDLPAGSYQIYMTTPEGDKAFGKFVKAN